MDKRLAAAIAEGLEEKRKDEQAVADKKRAAQEKHEQEILDAIPAAEQWVDKFLFKRIAEESRAGSETLVLGQYVDGISSEAIGRVVRKINGLQSYFQEDTIWEDSDYGRVRETRLYIKWTKSNR